MNQTFIYQEVLNYLSQFIYNYVELNNDTALIFLKFQYKTSPLLAFNNYYSGYYHHNNYQYLNASFLSLFSNTTRTGSAQKHFGISFKDFLSIVLISLGYCCFQIFMFSILRVKFKRIYQPNSYLINPQKSERFLEVKLANGFFSWVGPIWEASLDDYKQYGLDTFFFLRYLKVLSIFFLILTIVNTPILLLIHYNSGYRQDYKNNIVRESLESIKNINMLQPFPILARGLDRISMSNISPLNSHKLVFHLILSIFTILLFHFFLINELNNYISVRNTFILETNDTRQRILFINNIPSKLIKNKVDLTFFFENIIPDSIEQIVFIPKNFKELKQRQQLQMYLLNNVEKQVLDIIKYKIYSIQNKKVSKSCVSNDSHHLDSSNVTLFDGSILSGEYSLIYQNITNIPYNGQKLSYIVRKYYYFFRMIISLEFLSGFYITWMNCKTKLYITLPIMKFSSEYILDQKYNQLERTIIQYKEAFKGLNGMDSLSMHEYIQHLTNYSHPDNIDGHQHAFVIFKNPIIAHIFDQTLLYDNDKKMNKTLGIDFRDIKWNNLVISNRGIMITRILLSYFLSIVVIIGWVIPVAFVGLISQIPLVINIVPILSWINSFPSAISNIMNSILPVITLAFLIECIPTVFRWFSILKCIKTSASVELDVQKWFFSFLFVHIFLVVTISSGISAMIEKLINNPISIPQLLAQNLPKSSNFFCSFVFIRCVTYSSSNLFQTMDLILEIVGYNFLTDTPRYRLEKHTKIRRYMWGSIYPMFSVLASITIIYCIISPFILPLASFSFAIVFFSFKYTTKYVYQQDNPSETMGKFYPQAMMQLYSGVYFLEICLIGLFVLFNRYSFAICMLITFIMTIIAHFQISRKYKPLVEYLPTNLHVETNNTNLQKIPILFLDDQLSLIWIPNDGFNVSKEEKLKLEVNYGLKCTQKNSYIDNTGKLHVFGSPYTTFS